MKRRTKENYCSQDSLELDETSRDWLHEFSEIKPQSGHDEDGWEHLACEIYDEPFND